MSPTISIRILVSEGPEQGRALRLHPTPDRCEFRIGHGRQCDLRLNRSGLRRRDVRIRASASALDLYKTGRGGLSVNAERRGRFARLRKRARVAVDPHLVLDIDIFDPYVMVRNAELEQAVRDAPDLDGPRLIYADWLTREGDPRGELIALQCKLHARPPMDRESAFQAEQRVNELLRWHGSAWLAWLEDMNPTWHRGFVDSVSVDSATFHRAPRVLAREPGIRLIRASGTMLDEELAELEAAVAHLPVTIEPRTRTRRRGWWDNRPY